MTATSPERTFVGSSSAALQRMTASSPERTFIRPMGAAVQRTAALSLKRTTAVRRRGYDEHCRIRSLGMIDKSDGSARCRCMGREGWMETLSCPIFSFPSSAQDARRGTRAASWVRSVHFCQDRFGPFERGWNSPAIAATLPCSTWPSTASFVAATLSD